MRRDTDVADVDADAKVDSLIRGHTGIALAHAPLHIDRAANRIDDAWTLQQQTVARGLDDAADVLVDLEVDEPMLPGSITSSAGLP